MATENNAAGSASTPCGCSGAGKPCEVPGTTIPTISIPRDDLVAIHSLFSWMAVRGWKVTGYGDKDFIRLATAKYSKMLYGK